MTLTAAEIMELTAAGNAIRFRQDGTVSMIAPTGGEKRAMTAAERSREYRRRRHARVTENVTAASENVTNVTKCDAIVAFPSPPLSPPTPSPLAPTPLRNTRDEAASAEAIYDAYPRKVGRPKALKTIRQALANPPRSVSTTDWPAQLLAIVKRYAALRKGEDPQFTPHPATWFHQRRFEDDPSTWRTEAPAPRNGVTRVTGPTPQGLAKFGEECRREADRTQKAIAAARAPDSQRVSPEEIRAAKGLFVNTEPSRPAGTDQ